MTGKYRSVFDIIGPVMVGPSSSHTAGAVAIGHVANILIGALPDEVRIDYYESFAKTHLGHGTDYAIIAGLLGFSPQDGRVPHAVSIARDEGVRIDFVEKQEESPIQHPNTAVVHVRKGQQQVSIAGCSIGGGTIEIRQILKDDCDLRPGGPLPILIVQTPDNLEQEAKLHDSVIVAIDDMCISRHVGVFKSQSRQLTTRVYDLEQPLLPESLRELKTLVPDIIYVD